MVQLLLVVVACGLVVAGVATWSVGGALIVAGMLLAGLTYGFEFELVDDDEGGL